MAEGARLERVYTGNRIEGSNPSLSAIFFLQGAELRTFFPLSFAPQSIGLPLRISGAVLTLSLRFT